VHRVRAALTEKGKVKRENGDWRSANRDWGLVARDPLPATRELSRLPGRRQSRDAGPGGGGGCAILGTDSYFGFYILVTVRM